MDNTTDKEYWIQNEQNVSADDIKFQFFLRGIEVPKKEDVKEELKDKRRGKGKRTYKEYLLGMILDAIGNGYWRSNISRNVINERKAMYGR